MYVYMFMYMCMHTYHGFIKKKITNQWEREGLFNSGKKIWPSFQEDF